MCCWFKHERCFLSGWLDQVVLLKLQWKLPLHLIQVPTARTCEFQLDVLSEPGCSDNLAGKRRKISTARTFATSVILVLSAFFFPPKKGFLKKKYVRTKKILLLNGTLEIIL
jgi:hypothetical protein